MVDDNYRGLRVAEEKTDQAVKGEDLAARPVTSPATPSTDRAPGRQSVFFGRPAPPGNPEGVLPLNAEWAMRRGSVLQNMRLQMEFMRQAFALDDGVSCLVGLSSASCNPPHPGLTGFLSSPYLELHPLDPSLPVIRWKSHGYGQWPFELQD